MLGDCRAAVGASFGCHHLRGLLEAQARLRLCNYLGLDALGPMAAPCGANFELLTDSRRG